MSTLVGENELPKSHGGTPRDVYIPTGALWVVVAILALVFIYIFNLFFTGQFKAAIAEPSDWGHTFVVPLIAIWFVMLKRDTILQRPLQPAWAGLFFVVVGVFIYMLGSVGPKQIIHTHVRALGVCFAFFGLIVSSMGWRGFKECSFPFFYLFAFGIVITKRIMTPITNELQDISASGAWLLLFVLGFDVDLAGNTLTIYDGDTSYPLNVAEACSGMRMLVAFLALGTAMAYVGLNRPWQRVLLILLGIPVAVFVNVLRVVTLGFLSRYDVNFVSGEFHTFVGMVWLIPAFLVFILLMWIVRKLVVENPADLESQVPPGQKLRFTKSPIPQLLVAIAVLIAGAIAVQAALTQLNVYLVKKPVPLQASLDTIPSRISDWKQIGEEPEYSDAILESLGTTQFIDRSYVDQADTSLPSLKVHISYYTGTIDDVPHIPERCWYASGLRQVGKSVDLPLDLNQSSWLQDTTVNRATSTQYSKLPVVHPVTGLETEVRMPIGEPLIRVTVFEDSKRPDVRMVGGYFFIANGRITPSSLGVRNLAFNWTDEYAYYCKIQFSTAFKLSTSGNDFLQEFMTGASELTTQLLPQLMRCLPDWAEIESTELESNLDALAVSTTPNETK
jgi:exosortase